MLTCEEVTKLKSESMDSKISFRHKMSVKVHLIFCRWCRRYSNQLDSIRHALKTYNDKSDSYDNGPEVILSSEAKDRLKKSLKK
jgi:hypothetical protein